jgi:hypothetical protein
VLVLKSALLLEVEVLSVDLAAEDTVGLCVYSMVLMHKPEDKLVGGVQNTSVSLVRGDVDVLIDSGH